MKWSRTPWRHGNQYFKGGKDVTTRHFTSSSPMSPTLVTKFKIGPGPKRIISCSCRRHTWEPKRWKQPCSILQRKGMENLWSGSSAHGQRWQHRRLPHPSWSKAPDTPCTNLHSGRQWMDCHAVATGGSTHPADLSVPQDWRNLAVSKEC